MMRFALACLAACAAVPAPPPPPLPEGEFEGAAQLHDAHCGGAMLSDMQRAQLIRPAGNRRFLVFAGERNSSGPPAAELTTSFGGTFRVRLPAPGKYCVVDAARPRLTPEEETRLLAVPLTSPGHDASPGSVDQACIDRQPLACDERWESDRPGFEARIDLRGARCAWDLPCANYGGPAPP